MSDGPDGTVTTMPFGKYKGKFIADVPDDYLRWLEPQEFVYPRLRQAIRAELAERATEDTDHDEKFGPKCPDPALAREIIEVGIRTLSIRFRPDEEKLTMLDQCANWLRQTI